jgi:hypothetical protein
MNKQASDAITEMLNGFPQTNQDYSALLPMLARLCSGLSDEALISAADRFAAGDVKDQSKIYAPSSAQFVEEARRRDELLKVLARPRLPPPTYQRGPLAPYQIATQKKWAENAHLPVLFTDIDFNKWKALSAARDVPTGAKWVAALGVVFGSAPKPAE